MSVVAEQLLEILEVIQISQLKENFQSIFNPKKLMEKRLKSALNV